MRRPHLLLLCLLPLACASAERGPGAPDYLAFEVAAPPPLEARAWQPAAPAPPASTSGLGADLSAALPTVGHDLVDVFTSLDVWLVLFGGYAASELTDSFGFEESTTKFFAAHSLYPGGLSTAVEKLGTGYVLLAGAGGFYLWADQRDDAEGLAASKHLFRSLATTGISTIAFKNLFRDERPSGGSNGYPSGHTSMSVTAAASLWYSYGPQVGVPAALLASMVALQRLDSRAHELDDVIGGAVLGWVVARSLSDKGPLELFGARVLPSTSSSGDPGIALLWSY